MKNNRILFATALLILILAVTFAFASFAQAAEPTALQHKIGLPQIDTDLSEVGSTTGILIMGVVILIIISAPLIFRKKKH